MMDAAAAEREALRIVRDSGSSFFWGMRLVSAPRRRGMYALYAFSRAVDDVADGDGPVKERLAGLDAWREEIEALYAGCPQTLIGKALQGPVEEFDLPKAEFLALIEGMASDLATPVCAPSWQDLAQYCRRVAGSIGVLTLRILGFPATADDRLAIALGEALQLTNILRDLAEDARRGRLYLPAEILAEAGIGSSLPDAVLRDPKLALACGRVAKHAEADFAEARSEIQRRGSRSLLAPRIMLAFYARLLVKLSNQGWRPHEPVRLSAPEKLWLVCRELLRR
ncbi:presqualene diphosphate synthase HpnD [Limibacillus sp. MBR-115]|jgi:phytoene synthase|uniref:presqualene diphosphate synthase HpnD n=1 Tax=Limibacillus sp. MBR-115 TaxID=3156465 RepID=UPI00339A194D